MAECSQRIHDVEEVKELSYEGEVNKLLSEGWVLIHIYTAAYPDAGMQAQEVRYVLGRLRG